MGTRQIIHVEVAYAEARRQHLVSLDVPAGTRVSGALQRCREQRLLPPRAFTGNDVGIFGRRVTADRVLEPGDRVEIYRPLKVDPKEARRRRARDGRQS